MVRDYSDSDETSVRRIGDAIDGTAFFPGGHGLWRGMTAHGPLPETFPDQPVMIVGHNFAKVTDYERWQKRGIELVRGTTWAKLREYLEVAQLAAEECFFTNALMGLQPHKALGALKTTDLFRSECRCFLAEQISIVQPRLIVALGPVARADLAEISSKVPILSLMHPYATIRHPRLPAKQGRLLKEQLRRLT